MPVFTERKIVHAQQEADPQHEGATLTTRVEEVTPGWFSSDEPHREVIVEREKPPGLFNLFLGETEEVSRTRK